MLNEERVSLCNYRIYDDFCIISKEDVDEQIENAHKLIDAIKSYVSEIK